MQEGPRGLKGPRRLPQKDVQRDGGLDCGIEEEESQRDIQE